MIQYKIVPAVTAAGEPTYRLLAETVNMFGAGPVRLAENADRAVLERAIDHLKGASSAGGSRE